MRIAIILIFTCFIAAGCVTTTTDISPVQAVMSAAERPITGNFRFIVKATGSHDSWIYLNSETNYRDQRNISIEIPQSLVTQLAQKYGGDPLVVLKGKDIRVSGTARRVTIWLTFEGIRTDKYYYQTHVRVSDVSQITVL